MKTKKYIIKAIAFSLFFFISNYSSAQREFEHFQSRQIFLSPMKTSNNESKGSINPDFIIDSAYQLMQQGHFPGASLCIVVGDEPMWVHHLGYANIENDIPVSDSTIFNLASISKPVTATALMHLWEESDTFSLDDDINDFLPFEVENPNWPNEPITFFQLLTHTSSIHDNWFGVMDDLNVFGADSPIQLDTFLYHYLVPDGIYYNSSLSYNDSIPGSTYYDYSNIGFALVGYLVEYMSGIPFEDYCQQNMFEPLGMDNTSWFQANLDTNNIAMQYEWTGNGYNPYGLTGIPYYPCAQLRCTALDLAKFLSVNINHGTYNGFTLLDSLTAELITTEYFVISQYDVPQGLAWWFDPVYDSWIHEGGWYGVKTVTGFNKDHQKGVIFLSNGDTYTCSTSDFYKIEKLMFDFARQYHPLSIDSVYLSDTDGDHILEPGEDIELLFGFRNNMNVSNIAENVTIHLSSMDPSISQISDSIIILGNINYNEALFNETDILKFKLSNNLTSSTLHLELKIKWNTDKEYSLDFKLPIGGADVLLVKDENDWRGSLIQTEEWYLQAIDSLGYSTYYYDLSVFGDPQIEFLSNFPVIIWYTGYDLGNTLTENNQQALIDYLDNGGKLFLSGQNISDELAETDFLNNYLHTTHIEDTWSGIELVEGVEGDPIGNDLLFWVNLGDGVNGHNSMSVIDTFEGAQKVFNYYSTDYGAATRFENNTYKSVLFAFGFETINEFENRLEIMRRILNEYFGLPTSIDETSIFTNTSNDIHVFPNPCSDVTKLRLTVNDQQLVILDLYEISGVKIKQLMHEVKTSGTYEMMIELNDLPTGIYFLRLVTDDGIQVKRIVKL